MAGYRMPWNYLDPIYRRNGLPHGLGSTSFAPVPVILQERGHLVYAPLVTHLNQPEQQFNWSLQYEQPFYNAALPLTCISDSPQPSRPWLPPLWHPRQSYDSTFSNPSHNPIPIPGGTLQLYPRQHDAQQFFQPRNWISFPPQSQSLSLPAGYQHNFNNIQNVGEQQAYPSATNANSNKIYRPEMGTGSNSNRTSWRELPLLLKSIPTYSRYQNQTNYFPPSQPALTFNSQNDLGAGLNIQKEDKVGFGKNKVTLITPKQPLYEENIQESHDGGPLVITIESPVPSIPTDEQSNDQGSQHLTSSPNFTVTDSSEPVGRAETWKFGGRAEVHESDIEIDVETIDEDIQPDIMVSSNRNDEGESMKVIEGEAVVSVQINSTDSSRSNKSKRKTSLEGRKSSRIAKKQEDSKIKSKSGKRAKINSGKNDKPFKRKRRNSKNEDNRKKDPCETTSQRDNKASRASPPKTLVIKMIRCDEDQVNAKASNSSTKNQNHSQLERSGHLENTKFTLVWPANSKKKGLK